MSKHGGGSSHGSGGGGSHGFSGGGSRSSAFGGSRSSGVRTSHGVSRAIQSHYSGSIPHKSPQHIQRSISPGRQRIVGHDGISHHDYVRRDYGSFHDHFHSGFSRNYLMRRGDGRYRLDRRGYGLLNNWFYGYYTPHYQQYYPNYFDFVYDVFYLPAYQAGDYLLAASILEYYKYNLQQYLYGRYSGSPYQYDNDFHQFASSRMPFLGNLDINNTTYQTYPTYEDQGYDHKTELYNNYAGRFENNYSNVYSQI